jgi:hypothetical protein
MPSGSSIDPRGAHILPLIAKGTPVGPSWVVIPIDRSVTYVPLELEPGTPINLIRTLRFNTARAKLKHQRLLVGEAAAPRVEISYRKTLNLLHILVIGYYKSGYMRLERQRHRFAFICGRFWSNFRRSVWICGSLAIDLCSNDHRTCVDCSTMLAPCLRISANCRLGLSQLPISMTSFCSLLQVRTAGVR